MISGLEKIVLSPFEDHRGSFTRLYEPIFWSKLHPEFSIVNVNLSRNPKAHTLRGFHYSEDPNPENKVFHCLTGSILNVTFDVRPGSKTFGKVEVNLLSWSDNIALFVPGGCANAWMTLAPETTVLYLVSNQYDKRYERGIRFDDPAIPYTWPNQPDIISSKDLSWPDFDLNLGDHQSDA